MTGEQTQKLLQAFEDAEITKYEFITDMMTHYYNNDHAFIKYNASDKLVYNFRSNQKCGSRPTSEGNFEVAAAWCEDIHEVIFGANYDQINSLADKLGIELSDSELKLLINIEGNNYDIIPPTGDYVNAFHYLSQKEIDELSPEEKAKYEEDLAAYEKAKHDYIGVRQAASITVG